MVPTAVMPAAVLFDRLVVDGVVVPELFLAAVRRRDPVGRCGCGGLMFGTVEKTRRMTFYSAECGRCAKAITAPDGRLRQRPGKPQPVVSSPVADDWRAQDLARLGERDED